MIPDTFGAISLSPRGVVTDLPLLDELLDPHREGLGIGYWGYRAHCYRMVNWARFVTEPEEFRDEKLAIARLAASRLPHGPLTVGLTGGTTTHAVARLLAERYDLAVVTNALNIAAELALRPRIRLVMTGGVSRTQSYELVGPIADRTLAGLNIEIAIVGVDGISARTGLTTHDDIEANTNATMIRQAERVIVVADGSKVGRVCLARICALGDIDELITDASADPTTLAAVTAAGVTVTVAG